MKNNFKNIFVIIGLVASVMVILGGLIGWFSFPSDLQETVRNSSEMQESLNAKKSVSMFVGFMCLALVVLAARFRKIFLPIIILLLSGFVAFATLNHLREKSDLKDFDITMAPGYWMSMIGSLALLAAAVGIIINILKKPQPVGAALPQMPSNQAPSMPFMAGPVPNVPEAPQIPPAPVNPPADPGVAPPIPQPLAAPIPPQPPQPLASAPPAPQPLQQEVPPSPQYVQPAPAPTPPPSETPTPPAV